LASGDDFSDLLIFKRRGMATETVTKKEEAPVPQTLQTQPTQPTQRPAAEERARQPPQKPKASVVAVGGQQKDVKSLYCINHPWRSAYAYCAVDGLPYCFVDLIEYGGKTYCLNDIDSVLRTEGKAEMVTPKNGFSMISSALLLANVAVIFYFTQSQTRFVSSLALQQGFLNFLLNINMLYIFPVANIAVMVLGIMGAVAILKKSYKFFGIAFLTTFGSLFIMIYQYFSNSVAFALLSSVILMIAVSTVVYSRMSSVTAKTERYLKSPDIDWPKPELF